MISVIRGLFHERKKFEEGKTTLFFNLDILSKIIRLMTTYSIDEKIIFEEIKSIPIFLERLSYYLPEGKIKNLYDLNQLNIYFFGSNLNDFLSSIELFIQTLKDICDNHFSGNYSRLYPFITEFNNLLALKIVPFRIEITENKIFIDRINSPKEEENKKRIYELIDGKEFVEANEHFTNSLIEFAKRNYPGSIEEAYLALEKYLKIKINNHRLDVLKSYVEFKKLFDVERGIFKIHNEKIKGKIDFIYTIRSEIKSHSSKKTFDRKDLLEETARFQLNEVMNLIILLNSFQKK